MAKKPRGFAELLASDRSANNLRRKGGTKKMAEILDSFLEPYIDKSFDRQMLQASFLVGIAAWNIALLPQDRQEEAIYETFSNTVDKSDLEMDEAKDLMRELIERKERFFAHHQGWIADFDLQYISRGNYNISVATIQPPSLGDS